ncbi:MAG: ATP-binding protein [Oligoflexia bacterium]|nr:ATP-binding protein [Oligoflexia bacterium]
MASALRVSIKWKIFALVAVLIASALVIIVFRTSQIFREDKEAFVKELTAKLSSSAGKNIANRIATWQDKLVIFISSRESLANTGARIDDQLQVLFSRYQDFISIGFLTPNEKGALKTDWILRNPQGPSVQWAPGFEKTFLPNFDISAAAANGRALWKTKSPTGEWLVVLGFGVQIVDVKKNKSKVKGAPVDTSAPPAESTVTAWIMGVMSATALNDMLNDFSTGLNTGFIVDNTGVAVASSDATTLWSSIAKHPLVEEVLRATRPAGAGEYSDLEGRAVIGSYEWIPKMNLAVIVTTPRDKAFEAADTLMRNILFIGLIILIAALGTAVLLSNYITGPLQRLSVIAAEIGAGNFKVTVDVKTNDEIGELALSFAKMEQGLIERDEALASTQGALVQSEKMSAFGQLSAGIAHEVKNPLAGILGHAQLAMGKAPSADMKKHLEVIEKETRRCKTIVENLMKFARAEKAQLQATDLAQVCQDTINLVDHQLSLAGCKIYKDFQPCVMVDANANQLQQVLLNLMVNSSHAMESCPTKHVTVRVVQAGSKAQIQIEDTGVGIPPEIQKKIFEPFFTTKPAGKGTGLGLSVSIGIVKDHKGEIYIKSVMNKGTTFFIDIPIPEDAKMPDKELENTHGGATVAKNDSVSAPATHAQPSVKVAEAKKPEIKLEPKLDPKAPVSAPAKSPEVSKSDVKVSAPASAPVQAKTAVAAKPTAPAKTPVPPPVPKDNSSPFETNVFSSTANTKPPPPTVAGTSKPAPVAPAASAQSAPAPATTPATPAGKPAAMAIPKAPPATSAKTTSTPTPPTPPAPAAKVSAAPTAPAQKTTAATPPASASTTVTPTAQSASVPKSSPAQTTPAPASSTPTAQTAPTSAPTASAQTASAVEKTNAPGDFKVNIRRPSLSSATATASASASAFEAKVSQETSIPPVAGNPEEFRVKITRPKLKA